MLDHSTDFGETIPKDLSEFIARGHVNILGELHWVKQTHEFYTQIIPGLHEAGIRLILLEIPLSAGPLLDFYVTGQITDFPWEQTDLADSHIRQGIEAIRQWNESLRAADRAAEQMRLYAIDIDALPISSTYPALIRVLRREMGLAGSFFQYPQDNIKQLDEGVVSGLGDGLEQDFRWISQKMIESEDIVRPNLWGYQSENFLQGFIENISGDREQLIQDSVEYYLKKHDGEKALIIIGSAHAFRQDWLFETTEAVAEHSLAGRLVDGGYDVNSLLIQHRTIELTRVALPFNASSTMTFEYGELFVALEESYDDQRVWIDLRPLADQPLPVRLDFSLQVETQTYEFDLAQNFDGMIFLPKVDIDLLFFLE